MGGNVQNGGNGLMCKCGNVHLMRKFRNVQMCKLERVNVV